MSARVFETVRLAAGAGLALKAAVAPAAAVELETQWQDTDKSMHALVEDGFEVKGTIQGSRVVTVFLQKGKALYACEFGALMVQLGGCNRLVAPKPIKGP